MIDPTRVPVTVLLTFGDQAELLTPTRGADNPLRVPAADITRDTGVPADQLPGKDFTAVIAETPGAEMTARDFQPAGA